MSHDLRVFRLEQMTLFDLPPADVVSVTADLGLSWVGLWVTPGLPGTVSVDQGNVAGVVSRLDETGVAVDTVELLDLRPDPREFERALDLAARIGARTAVAIHADGTSTDEAAQRLGALCELAASYGIGVAIEPIAMGTTRTIAEGVALVEASGAMNAGLVVDLLHLVRTGQRPRDLEAVDPRHLFSFQVCDGPAEPGSFEEQLDEAMSNRLVPGAGDFQVVEFLSRRPEQCLVGLEVPQRSRFDAGLGHLERTRTVLDSALGLLAQAATDRLA